MKYFSGISNLDDLKREYKRLALENHPDRGGDTAVMQEINAEYDAAFSRLKVAHNLAHPEQRTEETAKSTRSEFYTANGWKGSRYDSSLSLKEIAQRVRSFVKEAFPTYRFSVRTEYASMCKELHVEMTESPAPVLKTLDELTEDDVHEIIRQANRRGDWRLVSWSGAEARAEIARLWDANPGSMYRIFTERATATIAEVDAYVQSYRYDDSDGMIDYFNNNFYYFGSKPGSPDKVKVVPRAERLSAPKSAASTTADKHLEKPAKAQHDAPQSQSDSVRVEYNTEHNGVEVYFPSKPADSVREALKRAGYRWHSVKKCWYATRTEERLQVLRDATERADLPA